MYAVPYQCIANMYAGLFPSNELIIMQSDGYKMQIKAPCIIGVQEAPSMKGPFLPEVKRLRPTGRRTSMHQALCGRVRHARTWRAVRVCL